MALSKVVIVYSPRHARRRTVIIPDDDSQVPIHTRNLKAGEAVLVVPLADYRLTGPDGLLEKHLGRPAENDRYAITDGAGRVTHFLCMDSSIDREYAGRAYHDPEARARIGDYVHRLGLSP